ncbi:MAG: hypothetical protein PVJ76_18000 [Gemmatimonadota bacterium]
MNEPALTVMTWNLYLGAQIDPVLKVGFQDQELLASTAAEVWNEILENDFRDRAVAIVGSIQAAKPDLVGFQELARFRSSARDSATGAWTATETLDFQAILEEELKTRRLPYSFAAVIENTRAEVPIRGFRDDDRFIATRSVELTVRDAVLVRETARIDEVSQGNYKAGVNLGRDPSGSEILMTRGWIEVAAEVGGFPVRFVNTHLETQPHSSVQLRQTRELLTEVVPEPVVATILVGDFNSDAAASPERDSWTSTYEKITGAGFVDTWAASRQPSGAKGCTCCYSPHLRDAPTPLDQRIDFIFVRGLGGPAVRPTERSRGWPGWTTEVLGRGPSGETSPGGRRPSDHAGLVTRFGALPFWS